MKQLSMLALLVGAMAVGAQGAIRVVTTIPDLADLTRAVGGDRVTVEHIVRGDQNPHVVDVKPSFMMKLKAADLFLMIGMELELWAQQIIDGSRNSALRVVDLSTVIRKLEVPATRVDASQGDVHRFGNPHYWLDPRNIRPLVEEIVRQLSQIAPADEEYFRGNAEHYLQRLEGKIEEWERLMKPYAGSSIVTFHRSWTYFASWLGLIVADQVEPKPGIQPSPAHTAALIRLVREKGIRAIVVEPFYDPGAAEQIARMTGAAVVRLETSPGGASGAGGYIAMMEYNCRTLAAALRGGEGKE